MASARYVGPAQYYEIEWSTVGLTGGHTRWDKFNRWYVTDLTEEQAAHVETLRSLFIVEHREDLQEVLHDLESGWQLVPGSGGLGTNIAHVGPVARTDENGAVVIDGIAYVVSGWVYGDDGQVVQIGVPGPWRGRLGEGTYEMLEGEYYAPSTIHNFGVRLVTADFTEVIDSAGLPVGGGNWETYSFDEYNWRYIERFDLENQVWLPRISLPVVAPGTDPYAAEGHVVAEIDGKIIFGGGDGVWGDSFAFFSFDPATEEFTRLPDLPVGLIMDYNPWCTARGKLYCFVDGIPDENSGPANVAIFDPVEVEWSVEPLTLDGIWGYYYDQIWGAEVGGKAYFVDQGAGGSFAVEFDPDTLTLTGKAQAPTTLAGTKGPLYVEEGKVHRVGGGLGVPYEEIYDPSTDSWSTREDVFNSPLLGYSALAAYEGVPYIFNGVYDPTLVGALEMYQPGAHARSWIRRANLPETLGASVKTLEDKAADLYDFRFSNRSFLLLSTTPFGTYFQRGMGYTWPVVPGSNVSWATAADGMAEIDEPGLYFIEGSLELFTPSGQVLGTMSQVGIESDDGTFFGRVFMASHVAFGDGSTMARVEVAMMIPLTSKGRIRITFLSQGPTNVSSMPSSGAFTIHKII